MNLTKNLTLAEVTKSTTAKRLGIDNQPDDWTIENLRAVGECVFQPLAQTCLLYTSDAADE